MDLIKELTSEIEQEGMSTLKIAERVPLDKFDWQPHEKSMTLKGLTNHIAFLTAWPGIVAKTDGLDFADKSIQFPDVKTSEELIKTIEENTKNSIETLKNTTEDELNKDWTLRVGDQVIMKMAKKDVIRKMALNHLYHHRAQLGVYLRMLNVPIPGMYGPSADDK